MPSPQELTRHHSLLRRYLGRDILSGREGRGYTAMDLFKFYALITGLLFALALSYIKYLDLFADALTPEPSPSVLWARTLAYLTIIPLLLALIALEGFVWWASGALVDYTRWQRVSPAMWRWFWFIVLNFYFFIVLDPLDTVHRLMSRNGLLPAPNMILLFSGKVETFQFQWGYFLLWLLFWFLVVVAHLSYFADGMREAWFYIRRINRYTASVLTGFRGTAAVAFSPPVTLRELPPAEILVPRLTVDRLSAELADAILAADSSGGMTRAPGQRQVLMVDLGSFYWTPALDALTDASGGRLLTMEMLQLDPVAGRSELVIPLSRGGGFQPPNGGTDAAATEAIQ